jgi:hypothetical protein
MFLEICHRRFTDVQLYPRHQKRTVENYESPPRWGDQGRFFRQYGPAATINGLRRETITYLCNPSLW